MLRLLSSRHLAVIIGSLGGFKLNPVAEYSNVFKSSLPKIMIKHFGVPGYDLRTNLLVIFVETVTRLWLAAS